MPLARSAMTSLLTSAHFLGSSFLGDGFLIPQAVVDGFFTLQASESDFRAGMELVRLFILKNNAKSFVDIPKNELGEHQAQIELSGGTVYHACVLPKPVKKPRARLRKRLY